MTGPAEQLIDQQLGCGESPVWDPVGQWLYWTDSGTDILYGWHRNTGQQCAVTTGTPVAALARHADGGLALAGQTGFFHWHPDKPLRLLAGYCELEPITAVNELIADPMGRLLGGQEKYRDNEPYQLGYLYQVDLDGTARILDDGFHLANGMGFSPDGLTFYLIDTIPRRLYAYDYHPQTGRLANRRLLIQLAVADGLPDGMTVDRDGYLWVARWFGSGLSRYDPDGCLERRVDLPVAQPTSLTFAGPDLDELVVTTAAVDWKTPLAPIGHRYDTPRGGSIYRIRGSGSGVTEFLARV